MKQRDRVIDRPKYIPPVRYVPRGGYALDLEIITTRQLRMRANRVAAQLGGLERIEFHMLILITSGNCLHMVDFQSLRCASRTLLMLRPGQVHRFDMSTPWQGWLVLFRPEFLRPRMATTPVDELALARAVDDLPAHFQVNRSEARTLVASIRQMHDDARTSDPIHVLHALLRSQLQSLLIRLHLIHTRVAADNDVAPMSLERFKRFRNMIETEFHRKHHVKEYAQRLGCSAKSLGRATLDAAGISAKRLLSQRITLEAKRLLSHTSLPVATIADKLGFDEATNFVKFFRRETGMAPGEFRQREL